MFSNQSQARPRPGQTILRRLAGRKLISPGLLFAILMTACFGAWPMAGWTSAQDAPQNERKSPQKELKDPLIQPLAKDDPRAQLNPEFKDALPVPASAEVSSQTQTENAQEPMVAEFNPATGEERQSRGQASVEALNGESMLAAMSGSAGPVSQPGASSEVEAKTPGANLAASLCIDNLVSERGVTHQFPMRAQVKLFITYPNGGRYVSSGTLIGSKYVITAGNSIYYAPFGGWARSIEVIPGLDGYYKPFGSAFMTYERHWYHGSSHIGLVTLDRHIGYSTGTLGYGYFPDWYLKSRPYGHIFGYPVDKDYGRVLYYGVGALDTERLYWDRLNIGRIFFNGEEGGGVYLLDPYGNRFVFAVDDNRYYCSSTASRITEWIYRQLASSIASGY